MEIVRNDDGTLVVPVKHVRTHPTEDGDGQPSVTAEPGATQPDAAPGTRVLHPGEGGYDEALA